MSLGEVADDKSDPFNSGYLKVSDLHTIYFEQHGNQDGKTILFVHGGPGALACDPKSLIYFDLARTHVVLLDQRGAGQSKPRGCLEENTSQLLVQDLETLRSHLEVQRWDIVFGGSWGSTLALLYAQTHPDAVSSLVLRGVFLFTESELLWMYGDPASPDHRHGSYTVYPDHHARFLKHLVDAGEDVTYPVGSYYRLLTSDDAAVRLAAAREWVLREDIASRLRPDMAEIEDELKDTEYVLSLARIEVWFMKNNGFLKPGQLLLPEAVDQIKGIPVFIVQGRYDMICPPGAAWALSEAIRSRNGYCELHWTVAGHAPSEPETRQKLVEIVKNLVEKDVSQAA